MPFFSPAFERGHCYEPYLQNGNFTTTDPLYGVGTVVQFTCDPGHSLEQGPPVIECISARDPYWNDTEPICKGKAGPPPLVGSDEVLVPQSELSLCSPMWGGPDRTWRCDSVPKLARVVRRGGGLQLEGSCGGGQTSAAGCSAVRETPKNRRVSEKNMQVQNT